MIKATAIRQLIGFVLSFRYIDLAGCELHLGYLLSLNRNLPPHECGFQ
nr:MAG TPA: hypothetical protein [Caudoviricetes sp.]